MNVTNSTHDSHNITKLINKCWCGKGQIGIRGMAGHFAFCISSSSMHYIRLNEASHDDLTTDFRPTCSTITFLP